MILNIQYLRAFAAIAVLLLHMRLWESKATSDSGILGNAFLCGDAGVDLFFVISGFIMVYIHKKPINTLASYFRFMAHRYTRIYPPYWIISAILLPIWLIKPRLFNNFYDNKVDLLGSMLLLPQNYNPLLAVGWTLIHEVYFYAVVSIALVFGNRGRILFGLIWFLIVFGTFMLFGKNKFDNIRIFQLIFSPFSLTFILGYFAGLVHQHFRMIPGWAIITILGIGIAGLIFGHNSISSLGVYPDNNRLIRFFGYGIPCFLIVISAVSIDRIQLPTFDLLKNLGNASYAIYLIHLPIVAAYYEVIKRARIESHFLLALAAAMCFLTCIAISMVFHVVIERRIIDSSRRAVESLLTKSSKGDDKEFGKASS